MNGLMYSRSFRLTDINIIHRAKGGDGRTVEAYAAVFDTPVEIQDRHGHYVERISRTAFNRQLGLFAGDMSRVGVYYHHGFTLHGTPSELGSVPIGHPTEIRPDGKGLLTVTRYNESPLADSVLEAIRHNDIHGYSFRGPIYRSTPERVPKRARGGPLPTVTRTELGLIEYGPTPNPAYVDASILAVRSAEAVAAHLAALDADERAELLRMLAASTTPDGDQETPPATPALGPGAEDQHDPVHSGRQSDVARRIRVGRVARGMS